MLNEKQRQRIEERLLEEREQATGDLRELNADMEEGEPAGELSRAPTHLADRGSDAQEEDMDAMLAERQAERVHAIDDALERLRQLPEEFGRSEISGRDIPFERLELIPWTRVLADEERSETGEPGRSPEVNVPRSDRTEIRGGPER